MSDRRLRLGNVVVDLLDAGFLGENGSRLREYLAAVRTAVLAVVEDSGLTHSELCHGRCMSVSLVSCRVLALHTGVLSFLVK